MSDKRINCNECPLCHVEVESNCEQYCSDIADFIEKIKAKAKSCAGCKHEHKWDIEVEFGCYSPCTICSRRCADNYEAD